MAARPLAFRLLSLLALLGSATACGQDGTPSVTTPPRIELRLLETTDIHVHLANYDYYRDAPNHTVGLANTATLIRQARAEVANSVLVDNGDLIQGNPLGDYVARERGLQPGEVHPVYAAMNALDYDVGNIGNHEFNYGLPFLDASLMGAAFPYVSANVFVDDGDADEANDEPYFTPYVIQEKQLVDTAGNPHTLKIGFIGFVPPQIMTWDRSNLAGQVVAKDMVAMAMQYVPQMRADGADLVIAIPHAGLDASPATGLDENATYYLASVPGIDALLFGHSHRVFPGPDYEGIAEVDLAKGTIRGVPAVMAGFWGSHLGVVDLTLEKADTADATGSVWQVVASRAEARPIAERVDGDTVPLVEPDQDVLAAIATDHQATLAWIRTPLGTIEAPIHSFFARVQDDPSIQIVTEAQKAYVAQQIQGTELDGLPVLSAGAPFKAGYGGPDNYTNVPMGTITYRNVADLYIYPNTLQVVRLTGSEVREWLERAAGAFNRIDPASTEDQPLLNELFPSYNFDVIDGVSYQIDVTQPARYDGDGKLVAPDSRRIVDLRYQDQPVADDQVFLVATNNYRAGGGGSFPGLTADKIVVEAPDENRQILANYIAEQQTVNPSADGNWRFAPVNDTVRVTFPTSPAAAVFAKDYPRLISTGETTADGYDVYRVDLAP